MRCRARSGGRSWCRWTGRSWPSARSDRRARSRSRPARPSCWSGSCPSATAAPRPASSDEVEDAQRYLAGLASRLRAAAGRERGADRPDAGLHRRPGRADRARGRAVAHRADRHVHPRARRPRPAGPRLGRRRGAARLVGAGPAGPGPRRRGPRARRRRRSWRRSTDRPSPRPRSGGRPSWRASCARRWSCSTRSTTTPTPVTGLAPTFAMIDELLADGRAYVDGLVEQVRRAGVDARGEVVVGRPADVILERAERLERGRDRDGDPRPRRPEPTRLRIGRRRGAPAHEAPAAAASPARRRGGRAIKPGRPGPRRGGALARGPVREPW